MGRAKGLRGDDLLMLIAGHIDRYGWAPTYREIMDDAKFRSLSGVKVRLVELERRGYLRLGTSARQIAVTESGWEHVGRLEHGKEA